ncbi:MAG: DUF1294 domain-containing protein [bacterium]|nr:DUF1294 domain-containing protein [bacterium]MDI1335317.1 DUF1294 domain-containing protein [Lacunisphaera sp.]
MPKSELEQFLIGWTALASAWAFILFGFDKWRAGRGGARVAESTLCWVSALGGWPGAFLGLVFFRHKSAKPSFQLKFGAAFFFWAGLVAGALKLAGRW